MTLYEVKCRNGSKFRKPNRKIDKDMLLGYRFSFVTDNLQYTNIAICKIGISKYKPNN